ncbi:MAG: site-2 protease family protein [Desulfobacteraceae bacterium]|nr:site-2 protease family protein [Desulfobacteraceae bacterium]
MMNNIGQFIIMIVPLIFAITIHEAAHGYAALRMGDRTAELSGRVTLNPISHFDLFGSLILPLMLKLLNTSIMFGYAKPVPVNPNNYRYYRMGTLIVSSAGVAANLACAVISGILFRALRHSEFAWTSVSSLISKKPIADMLEYSVIINLVLMVFNLIPVPPLDGSRILGMVLPDSIRPAFQEIERFGMIILIVLMMTKIIDKIIHAVVNPLSNLLLGA